MIHINSKDKFFNFSEINERIFNISKRYAVKGSKGRNAFLQLVQIIRITDGTFFKKQIQSLYQFDSISHSKSLEKKHLNPLISISMTFQQHLHTIRLLLIGALF